MSESQMAQAQINTTIFHQVNGKNGEIRFRTKFGRQKVMVFRRHDETKYFYWIFTITKAGDICVLLWMSWIFCAVLDPIWNFLNQAFLK